MVPFLHMMSHQSANVYYETDDLVTQYIDFHFGPSYFGTKNFPKSIVDHAVEAMGVQPKNRALDLGCAVGRGVFELAKHFENVLGIDYSEAFIKTAQQMEREGQLSYYVKREGDLVDKREVTLENLHLTEKDLKGKITFLQGDACALTPDQTAYDLVIAANLIDRLYEPKKFLRDVQDRVNLGGTLAISSPYTWLEEHTKKENWIGGRVKDGKEIGTLEALKEVLSPKFELIGEPKGVEFVIRETKRKHQHTVAELSLWRKVQN